MGRRYDHPVSVAGEPRVPRVRPAPTTVRRMSDRPPEPRGASSATRELVLVRWFRVETELGKARTEYRHVLVLKIVATGRTKRCFGSRVDRRAPDAPPELPRRSQVFGEGRGTCLTREDPRRGACAPRSQHQSSEGAARPRYGRNRRATERMRIATSKRSTGAGERGPDGADPCERVGDLVEDRDKMKCRSRRLATMPRFGW
jgi:hypothetical protein